MAVKISISLPESTLARVDQDTAMLRAKNLKKPVSCSAVINAHLKRSFGIPAPIEVTP